MGSNLISRLKVPSALAVGFLSGAIGFYAFTHDKKNDVHESKPPSPADEQKHEASVPSNLEPKYEKPKPEVTEPNSGKSALEEFVKNAYNRAPVKSDDVKSRILDITVKDGSLVYKCAGLLLTSEGHFVMPNYGMNEIMRLDFGWKNIPYIGKDGEAVKQPNKEKCETFIRDSNGKEYLLEKMLCSAHDPVNKLNFYIAKIKTDRPLALKECGFVKSVKERMELEALAGEKEYLGEVTSVFESGFKSNIELPSSVKAGYPVLSDGKIVGIFMKSDRNSSVFLSVEEFMGSILPSVYGPEDADSKY